MERLGSGVQHHVNAAAGQVGETVLRDGRGDDGLAGQILQPEAGQLVVGGNHDVTVAGGASRHRIADPATRCLDQRLQVTREPPDRPHSHVGCQPEDGVGVQPGRQVQSQQRVGELQV